MSILEPFKKHKSYDVLFGDRKERKSIITILELPEDRVEKYLQTFKKLESSVILDQDLKKVVVLIKETNDFLSNIKSQKQEKTLFDFFKESPKKTSGFFKGIIGEINNFSTETMGHISNYGSGMTKEMKSIYNDVQNGFKNNSESPFTGSNFIDTYGKKFSQFLDLVYQNKKKVTEVNLTENYEKNIGVEEIQFFILALGKNTEIKIIKIDSKH